ncbi:MAG: CBS domain-containing protein [Anaerolineae bacterium]|nr:CBS domain-containing protein [Anaerolineae bacterium]
MRQQLVKDWMTRDIVTVAPEMRMTEAHQLMLDRKIRRLPVVRNKHLVGIVTRGDIRGAEPSEASSLNMWEMNYLISKLRVKDVMARTLVTIPVDATIADAAQLMLERKVSGLPVVDNNKVVGIITESDIFRMVVQAWEKIEA